MLVPVQRQAVAPPLPTRCLDHSRWLARCPACTAYHLDRLRQEVPRSQVRPVQLTAAR